jgi:hypothetical protein
MAGGDRKSKPMLLNPRMPSPTHSFNPSLSSGAGREMLPSRREGHHVGMKFAHLLPRTSQRVDLATLKLVAVALPTERRRRGDCDGDEG